MKSLVESFVGKAPGFFDLFGTKPVFFADAPGRVHLLGEHTAAGGGHVLSMAIPQKTYVEACVRQDEHVRVWTSELDGSLESYSLGAEVQAGDWLDYIKGVTYILRKEGFRIRGFDLRILSNIPLGSGLSSSASLEIAMLRVLRSMFALPLDDLRLAQLCEKIEKVFVRSESAVMDSMAASLAFNNTALKIDARNLRYIRISVPWNCEITVIDSGIKSDRSSPECRQRQRDCREAAQSLGLAYLTDLPEEKWFRLQTLPLNLQKRARHVVTENARVEEAADAMKAFDLPLLGRLLYESHDSLRDDYEISVPEIDWLIEKAKSNPDIYGARMTGGGFGGSVVLAARPGKGREAARKILKIYSALYSNPAAIVLPLDS